MSERKYSSMSPETNLALKVEMEHHLNSKVRRDSSLDELEEFGRQLSALQKAVGEGR